MRHLTTRSGKRRWVSSSITASSGGSRLSSCSSTFMMPVLHPAEAGQIVSQEAWCSIGPSQHPLELRRCDALVERTPLTVTGAGKQVRQKKMHLWQPACVVE